MVLHRVRLHLEVLKELHYREQCHRVYHLVVLVLELRLLGVLLLELRHLVVLHLDLRHLEVLHRELRRLGVLHQELRHLGVLLRGCLLLVPLH